MLYLCLSLSLSLTTHFVLIRYFSDPNHNGAPRGRLVSHTLVIPHFFHYQLFSNPDFEIPVFNFLLFGCGGDFAGNRGRRTSRRRF